MAREVRIVRRSNEVVRERIVHVLERRVNHGI